MSITNESLISWFNERSVWVRDAVRTYYENGIFTDKDIIHEITIMKNLDHPHIIKLYEFYIDDYNYYLINEYCTEGDLSEKMVKLKSLPEQIVKILMAQIFNAVLCCFIS